MDFSLKKITAIDCKVMLLVARQRTNFLTLFLKLVTYSALGRAWFGVAITLNLLDQRGIQVVKDQTIFLNALLAPLATWLLGLIIKIYFKRRRPFQFMPNFSPLVKSPIDDSFPSLHAASTTAFFVALIILNHPLAPWVGLWSALASFSRLYLGVHFLSDILGGTLLGVLCARLIF
mgnify:CR=1 FL=1